MRSSLVDDNACDFSWSTCSDGVVFGHNAIEPNRNDSARVGDEGVKNHVYTSRRSQKIEVSEKAQT